MEKREYRVTARSRGHARVDALRMAYGDRFDPVRIGAIRPVGWDRSVPVWSVEVVGDSLEEAEARALWGDR